MELETKGIIKADLIAARQAMDYYKEKGIKDIKNIAAFHLQQAAEKLIKYQIYKKVAEVDNHRVYTHNIDKLIDYADSLGIEINIPNYAREHAAELTDWEAGSRYFTSSSVDITVLEEAYDIISSWEKEV